MLGTDIVVEITPIHPIATTKRKHHRLVAVVQRCAVVKMLNSRTCYEQRLPFCLFSIVSKFPPHLYSEISAHASLRLLPGRGIGFRVVIVLGIITRQSSRHTGLCYREVKGGGNE